MNDYSGLGGITAIRCFLKPKSANPLLAGRPVEYRPSTNSSLNVKNANRTKCLVLSAYNGMIALPVGYGIKGVVWYQGENNASQAQNYRSCSRDDLRTGVEKCGAMTSLSAGCSWRIIWGAKCSWRKRMG